MADLGGPGLATVVHDTDGTVHAFTPNNQELPSWPSQVGPASTSTMIGASDLDADGLDELLVAVGSFNVLSADGRIAQGWPFQVIEGGFQCVVPTAARFHGAAAPHLVAANGLGRIFLLNTRAEILSGWPVILPPGQFRHPLIESVAVGDITGNGNPDIVTTNFNDSRVFAYDQDGGLLPSFPVTVGRILDEPTLGDLDGDGDHEIVFWTDRTSLGGPGIIVLNGDGTLVEGWPQATNAVGNFGVALGDVDGDGRLELLAGTVGNAATFEGGVYLWNDDGTPVPGWPKLLPNVFFASPMTIADVDGDGRGDIVAPGETSVGPSTGVVHAWNGDGHAIPGFPLNVFAPIAGAVTVTDIDQDGIADLNVTTFAGVFITLPGTIRWWNLGVPYRPEGMEWPTRAHDMARTGAYAPPVRRVGIDMRLLPRTLGAGTPAPPLTAVLTPADDASSVPTQWRLVQVDGQAIEPVDGTAVGERTESGRPFRRRASSGRLVFRFDGGAVRARLGGPGAHNLTFRSDVIGGLGGDQFEAEATITVRPLLGRFGLHRELVSCCTDARAEVPR
ncbi:MAG: FG-GAP repeat domain-containing protein [Rhodospirillales bacterium]